MFSIIFHANLYELFYQHIVNVAYEFNCKMLTTYTKNTLMMTYTSEISLLEYIMIHWNNCCEWQWTLKTQQGEQTWLIWMNGEPSHLYKGHHKNLGPPITHRIIARIRITQGLNYNDFAQIQNTLYHISCHTHTCMNKIVPYFS